MKCSDLNTDQQTGLAVGAGREQLPSIARAQARGLRVVALDGSPQAEGLRIADIGEVVDLEDTNAVSRIAKTHGVSFTLPLPIGRLLTTQAAVHNALGLRGVSHECALACTDKHHFQRKMQDAGISVPWQKLLLNEQELRKWNPRELTYPVVLKPRRGSGSRGVRVIPAQQDWPTALLEDIRNTPKDGWIVEQYIYGVALGVDGVLINGSPKVVLVRKKQLSPWPHRVELAYRAPTLLSPKTMHQLDSMLSTAWNTLNGDSFLFHADLILQPDGRLVMIEMSARPSGLGIAAEMVPACTGIDFLNEGINLHLTGKGNFNPQQVRPTILHHWSHPGGRVEATPNVEQLLRLPHVISADVKWKPGQQVQSAENAGGLQSAGHLLVSAPSWDEAEASLNKALSLFEISSNEF